MKKENVIKLLKNRQVSYKELANITGYHEKSLIRLNKEIKNNTKKDIKKPGRITLVLVIVGIKNIAS